MSNFARLGMVTAGLLVLALPAGADSVTYNINGQMGKTNNTCFNIGLALTGHDCSYANTRSPPATWRGPIEGGGYYAKGSIPVPFPQTVTAARINLPLTGTVTVDDNGTPANGADDLISATFVFGAADFYTSTGQGDFALERWDSFTHTMAPTPVNAATPTADGFEYVIGARGKPTPAPLFILGDTNDTFPSENAKDVLTIPPPNIWDATVANGPSPAQRADIARSLGYSSAGGSPETFVQNIGATTKATFVNYECIDNAGDVDCAGTSFSASTLRSSASLFGPNRDKDNDGIDDVDAFSAPFANYSADGRGPSPDTNSVPLGPGFSNLILIITTGINQTTSLAQISSAQAYWTREYILANGPKFSMESPSIAPLQYTVNNSWEANRFSFTGSQPQPFPTAVDDPENPGDPAIQAPQDVATAISVLANDTLGTPDPNVLSVERAPGNGTLSVGSSTISYTPNLGFAGDDDFDYRLTDGDNEFDVATVRVTVANKLPVAGTFTASSRNGAPTSAINVLAAPTVLGTGNASQHTVTIAASNNGTCTAGTSTVTFTPTAGGGTAPGSCQYTIADASVPPDTSTGTVNVTVTGNDSSGGGGSSGPELPSGSSLDWLTLAALLGALPLLRRRRAAR